MNGDSSRFRFVPDKAYSSVRSQQGRVALDADHNEDVEIRLHDTRATRADVIGLSGAPADAPGFALSVASGVLRLSPGRYYVDGIRCDLATPGGATIPVGTQPFAPDEPLPTAAGIYVAYLDVWERIITAIQDPTIREVALGGPDTSTRTQVVWQVKLLKVTPPAGTPNCDSVFPEWDRLRAGGTGTLQVREAAAGTTSDPCVVTEQAGFRGIENQLYRVQIHAGNFDPTAAGGAGSATPTFKWSRDNASVAASLLARPASLELTVDRLGPGGANGLEIGEWIEVTDDTDDLSMRGGVLAEIDDVGASTLELSDPDGSVAANLPTPDPALHPQVRRWDSSGARVITVAASELGTSTATSDGWLRIEDGIEVHFGAGSYRAGDAWTFAARTAVLPGTNGRHLEWPTDGAGTPIARGADGPRHHFARLGLLQNSGTTWTVVQDCRTIFAPLVDHVTVDARGGDGQHGRSNHWLPAPLRVGVSRGRRPVVGARVRFQLASAPAGGGLNAVAPDENGTQNGVVSVDVTTDGNGIAQAWWRLGPAPLLEERGDRNQPARAQQVTATLLGPSLAATNLPVHFGGIPVDGVILKDAGGNGQVGKPGETLKIALRVQVSDGVKAVVGAHVKFSIENRQVLGAPLNQSAGGALHASSVSTEDPPINDSSIMVSTTPWPNGGTEAVEAVVATDDKGIAQLQWRLGKDTRLPIQRVLAKYIDDTGTVTNQQMLFTAQLALAGGITWTPCKKLEPMLGGATDVQTALTLFCNLIGGGTTPPFRLIPDWDAVIKRVEAQIAGAGLTALADEASIPLATFAGISLTTSLQIPWSPIGGGRAAAIPPASFPYAFRLEAENVVRGGTGPRAAEIGHAPVRLEGTLAVSSSAQGATLAWTMDKAAKTWLAAQVRAGDAGKALRVELTLVPAFLPATGYTDSSVRFTRAFWLQSQS